MSSKGSMAKEVEERRRTRVTSLMIKLGTDQDQIKIRSGSDDQTTSLMAMFNGCPSIVEVGDRSLFLLQKLHDIFFRTVSILDWGRRWVRTRKTHGPGKRDLEGNGQSRKIKIVLLNCELYYESSHDIRLLSYQEIDR